MYARIPDDLREPLIKELKQMRVRTAIKYYPLLVIIFSAMVVSVSFVKGHAFIHLLQNYLPRGISDSGFLTGIIIVIILITSGGLIYFLRQDYADCRCDEYLYCQNCDAVDNFESGCCPVCAATLKEKASFIFTTYKNEQEVIERWGLHGSKAAKSP